MPLSLMHRQYIPSARMVIFFLLLLIATGVAKAATFGVTTPGQQTLTNRFLPYAGSGTQLIGNSPAWRDSAGVLGINNYLEGLETLTPAAAVNLNFSTWRTKRITLNQNTVFTAINIPSVSTNVQTMLLEVIGDGAFTVSFANVTWQTPEITTPEAGVVTLYALRGDSGAVKGYTQAVTATGIGPLTAGYVPLASATNNLTDSILQQPNSTNLLETGSLILTNGVYHTYTDGTAANPAYGLGVTFGAGWGLFRDVNGEPSISSSAVPRARFSADSLRIPGGNAFIWSVGDTETTPIRLGIYSGNGSPEGVQTANPGSLYLDYTNGDIYKKSSGVLDTGWAMLSTGAGSPLWASSSGNLIPSPAVDVVSIQSQSASAATNVAASVNTAASWTHADATLQRWQNNGTNLVSLRTMTSGGVLMNFGENSTGTYAVMEKGGGAAPYFNLYTTDPTHGFNLYGSGFTAHLKLLAGSAVRTALDPAVADGTAPYSFGSSVSHTLGNLVEVSNNGTNKVSVDYLGNVTANGFIAATTNMVGALANKVTGAASSTDNDLMTFSSTSGKLAKVSTSAGTLGDASSTFYDLLFSISAGSPTLTATNGLILVGGSANLAVTNATAKLTLGTWNEAVSGTSLTFFPTGSSAMLSVLTTGVRIKNTGILDFGAAADSISRENTGIFQFGTDAAAATDVLLKADDGLGTDKAGAAGGLAAGRATGTGRPGDLTLQTGTTSTTSAATQNALTTRFQAVSKAVDLTESTATAFQKFTLATNNYAGGSITATVRASDAAFAMQSLTSTLKFDAVNVGGTNVVTVTQVDDTLAQIPTGGTLTCTYDAIDEGSNVFSLRANAASSLTQTALRIKWVITALNSSDAIIVTPQP